MSLANLVKIIESTPIAPTIINPESKFVVCTYWWGRGNNNQNTARPCIMFFEQIINGVNGRTIQILNTLAKENIPNIVPKLEDVIINLSPFKNYMEDRANAYNGMIYDYVGGIDLKASPDKKDLAAIAKLEKLKQTGFTPASYEYKNKQYTITMLTKIMREYLKLAKDLIFKQYLNKNAINDVQIKYNDELKANTLTPEKNKDYKQQIKVLNDEKAALEASMKKLLTTAQTSYEGEMAEFNNMSIMQILHKEFRFLEAIKYDEMIKKWEGECAKNNCNYMAVEYPEFAKPGGYQLAINAKPLFIKKALEACSDGNRAVLYIDGDMFIRKYPKIFDMTQYDFMARCWWIDPRSSYNMMESILYDPYTMETSGGTMWFSQSDESKTLIAKWIEEASKPYQQGKADDRVLSLVFNSYKFLLSMKVLLLPIEYLWLSLDYDERMLENIYDYNVAAMKQDIIIEHPECLTSEDTATGAGASSNRTPKFYSFIGEETLEPVSEMFHEYVVFPSKEMANAAFGSYMKYMKSAFYMDDGNETLIRKGLSVKGQPELNEQLLYVVSYDDKYGNFKYISDDELTYNEVAEINTKRAANMNVDSLNLVKMCNVTEINDLDVLRKEDDPNKFDYAKIISLVIKLLGEGKTVIYNPILEPEYDAEYYNILKEKMDSTFGNMEFVFVPRFNKDPLDKSLNFYYKPEIMVNQPMLFRPSEQLIKFLTMFLTFKDLSKLLSNGSYEFMSNVRVGYNIKKSKKKFDNKPIEPVHIVPASLAGGKKVKKTVAMKKRQRGGQGQQEAIPLTEEELDKIIDEYNAGLEAIEEVREAPVHSASGTAAGEAVTTGGKKTKKSKKTKKVRFNLRSTKRIVYDKRHSSRKIKKHPYLTRKRK